MFHCEMGDTFYKMKLIRRKCYQRLALFGIIFTVSFYLSVFLLGNHKLHNWDNFIRLDSCPACYGVSICPELYSGQIVMDKFGWTNVFNAKNIYYGYTQGKSRSRAVIKMLAHNQEFKYFDANFCKSFNLKTDCKTNEMIKNYTKTKKLLQERIDRIVEYNLSSQSMVPRKGLLMCPYSYSIHELLQPLLRKEDPMSYSLDLMYTWTMLMINPEPIILQLMQKSRGWPVPAYGGVCGRLEVVSYEGEPISSLLYIEWKRKLKIAHGILNAAMAFTYKHDRFRFYLMDWSMDNIVANDNDVIAFVDLEDVIVLDKQISPGTDLPSWYKRYIRENHPGFSFSIDNICKHHLSDHNIWAACYVLAGDDPFLYPIPDSVNSSRRTSLDVLLKKCLNGEDRFRTVVSLQQLITDMLATEMVAGS